MRWVFLLALVALCTTTGCRQQSLFDEKLPRHQFEDYDTARQGMIPAEVPNEFGQPEPNLRARLGGR